MHFFLTNSTLLCKNKLLGFSALYCYTITNVKKNCKGRKIMRKHYIDNIRWMTVFLVVIYHIIYIYNGICTSGIVGPFSDFQAQDAVQYILYPWFMVILFIVAGISSRAFLENHTGKEFLKSRTRKLLIPSTLALFVFHWIQGYFNISIGNGFEYFPKDFPKAALYFIMAFSGTGVLWFIQMLWIFSVLLLLVKKIDRNDRFYNFCGKSNIAVVLLLGIASYGASHILNTPIILVYRFGIYGFAFFTGYFVFSHEPVIEKISRLFFPFACIAVILGAVYVYFYFGQSYVEPPVLNNPAATAFMWFTCLAILGGAKRYLDKTNSFFTFMRKNSFPLYVFHYLPLSAAAYYLNRYTSVSALPSYLIVTVSAFLGSWILNAIISNIPFLRWCILGIKKGKSNV